MHLECGRVCAELEHDGKKRSNSSEALVASEKGGVGEKFRTDRQ